VTVATHTPRTVNLKNLSQILESPQKSALSKLWAKDQVLSKNQFAQPPDIAALNPKPTPRV